MKWWWPACSVWIKQLERNTNTFLCFFVFFSIPSFFSRPVDFWLPDQMFSSLPKTYYFLCISGRRGCLLPPPKHMWACWKHSQWTMHTHFLCLIFSWCYVFDVWTLTAHAVLKLLFKFFFSTWVFNKKFSCQSLLDKGGHLPICLSSFPLTFPDRKGTPGEGVTPEGGDMQFA